MGYYIASTELVALAMENTLALDISLNTRNLEYR